MVGTSAGASVMSDTMIVNGEDDELSDDAKLIYNMLLEIKNK